MKIKSIENSEKILTIHTDSKTIFCTKEHMLLMGNKAFKKAKYVKVNDELFEEIVEDA